MDRDLVKKEMRGIALTAVAPLTKDGEVDDRAIHRIVDFLIERGINHERGLLVPLSTTANFVSLSTPEKKQVARAFIEACKSRIPVAVGCNNTNLRDSIEVAQYAQRLGAIAIMVSPPFYWKPTEAQVIDHFRQICGSIDIGVIVYNNHWATQLDLSVDLIERLLEFKNIVGLKESTYSISKLHQISKRLATFLNIFNGLGEMYEPMYTQLGCAGFTSTIGNILPGYSASLQDLLAARKFDDAQRLAKQLEPIASYLDTLTGGQYIPALLHVLNRYGVCEETVRAPLIPLSPEETEQLDHLVSVLG